MLALGWRLRGLGVFLVVSFCGFWGSGGERGWRVVGLTYRAGNCRFW